MFRSYDIFLSHSGAKKDFVEDLSDELVRVCRHRSVFFDRDALEHGEQISKSILEYAGTCKLAVAVVSEEYFTRSRPPMMELAASYTAAKARNGSPSLPCLLPVFLALRPEDAKDSSTQLGWMKMWKKWEVNEKMSERRKSRPRRVEPRVWKEAVDRLLDTRGPIYIPEEYGYDPEVFLKEVAQVIARRLDDLNGGVGPAKVGDRLMPPYEEVHPCEDKVVEEDSSESSCTDSGLVFINPLLGSGSSRDAGKVTDVKEALPEPYRVLVCLEFGSTSSSFSFSHISFPGDIYTHYEFPGSANHGVSRCRTVTGIYYSSRDGGQSYQVESWGNAALSSYERGQREAGRSSENFFGMYVTRFNPHLKGRDVQISTTEKLKLPSSLPVDRPITDFLHEFGAYILHRLQCQYCGLDLTMKMIQWCVPVPSSWDNAAQEKMKICMESAGLINGADGSPYPVKMVGELEAASFWSLKSNVSPFLVKSESTYSSSRRLAKAEVDWDKFFKLKEFPDDVPGYKHMHLEEDLGYEYYDALREPEAGLVLLKINYCQESWLSLKELSEGSETLSESDRQQLQDIKKMSSLIDQDYLVLEIQSNHRHHSTIYIKAEKVSAPEPGIHIRAIPAEEISQVLHHGVKLFAVDCNYSKIRMVDLEAALVKEKADYSSRNANCWDYALATTKTVLKRCAEVPGLSANEKNRLLKEHDSVESNLASLHVRNSVKNLLNRFGNWMSSS